MPKGNQTSLILVEDFPFLTKEFLKVMFPCGNFAHKFLHGHFSRKPFKTIFFHRRFQSVLTDIKLPLAGSYVALELYDCYTHT